MCRREGGWRCWLQRWQRDGGDGGVGAGGTGSGGGWLEWGAQWEVRSECWQGSCPGPGELQGWDWQLHPELRKAPGLRVDDRGEGRRLVLPASDAGGAEGRGRISPAGSAGLMGGRVWEGSPVSTQARRSQACGCGIDRCPLPQRPAQHSALSWFPVNTCWLVRWLLVCLGLSEAR